MIQLGIDSLFARDVHRCNSNHPLSVNIGSTHGHCGSIFRSGVLCGDRGAAVHIQERTSLLQGHPWRHVTVPSVLLQDAPPQYYSSRQTLVGNPCLEQTHDIIHDNTHSQSGQLFLIGLPSSYRLPSLEAPLPRLPSYESVRKKDRQRQIHMMIADRFGLNGSMLTEPPPTYEESIRHSIEVPFDILGSVIDAPHPQDIYPPHPGTDLTTQSERNHSVPVHSGYQQCHPTSLNPQTRY
ncbi:uncharacterized protein isoform X2 [Salmo salar]|uniref:Uncharacterized protein isoform X2 n=1 Tax=Salmo salar TaxID=8030 RepID=A0ABM3EJE5_SALSA|nr:uncharacterized protein LOC106601426 isoform X2 [Salmo salar]